MVVLKVLEELEREGVTTGRGRVETEKGLLLLPVELVLLTTIELLEVVIVLEVIVRAGEVVGESKQGLE